MPIEVRELVIKATIAQDEKQEAAAQDTNTDGYPSKSDELIKACVDKILEILKERDAR